MARRERREEAESLGLAPEIEIEPRREAVGRQLQRAREELGESLQDVSQELRIRYVYLHAIEQCRYDELPGPTYAVGFIRGYADYLGLPSEEVVRRFKEEMTGLPRGNALQFPVPKPEGRIPGLAILLLSLLLLALAYGGWYAWNSQGERLVALLPWPSDESRLLELPASSSETSAPTAEPLMAPAPSPIGQPQPAAPPEPSQPGLAGLDGAASLQAPAYQSPAPAADPSAEEPGLAAAAPEVEEAPVVPDAPALSQSALPDLPLAEVLDEPQPAVAAGPATAQPEASASAEEPAAGPERPAAVPVESLAARTEDAIPAPPPAGSLEALNASGHAYGAVNSDARVRIHATADSWVQVRDEAEQPLFTQVLRSGDSYSVPNRPGLTLHTGNAGGLELAVDGVRLPALGPMGAVRRNIALDPERLLSGAR